MDPGELRLEQQKDIKGNRAFLGMNWKLKAGMCHGYVKRQTA